jgi:uncharacterized repeat protein (TIGR01451 family)
VGVGDEAGFALYVVNSGPVTATEVLVWNPLPTRTTYVSASGGAFPVIGSTVMSLMPWQMGAGLSQPPEGHAYDARVGASAPLTDPTGVTGIAWVGDVPPGEMQTLGLIAGVNGPGERTLVDEMFIYDDRELAGRFSGQTWVRPFSHYLPLVANRAESPPPTPTPVPTATTTTVTFTIPYGEGLALGGGSKDPDYWQALTGSDLEGRFGDGNGVSLGQSPPDGPYIPDYTIVRAYAGWETAALPDEAEVLSATLVLEVGCNPPESPFGTTVYRGIWTPPLSEDAWYAMGDEPAGTWDTADYPCTGHVGSGQVRIELNPTVVNQTGLTLLEIRSDREGTPPTAYERIRVTRSPQFPALVITCVEIP